MPSYLIMSMNKLNLQYRHFLLINVHITLKGPQTVTAGSLLTTIYYSVLENPLNNTIIYHIDRM